MDETSVPGPSTSLEFVEVTNSPGNAEEPMEEQKAQRFDEDIGEFYFESDAIPLKTNNDYKAMLKAMVRLESQRIQAIKDLDRLREVQEDALMDPIGFVKRLQNGEDLNLPSPQQMISLPFIDWKIYRLNSGGPSANKGIAARNWTRGFAPYNEDSRESVNGNKSAKPNNLVRGRAVNDSKSVTFNQLWTAEEQKKLEELLIKYPPEEIELRRWTKIANDLGNRTPAQVQSRIQKFFIKLSKAGLPVPGRRPALAALRKGGIGRIGRPSKQFYQYASSSFFKHNLPPVYMDESNQSDEPSYYPSSPSTVPVTEDDATEENEFEEPSELENDPEYQELIFLQQLKDRKLGKHEIVKQGLAQHIGYKCDRCNCEPIIGTRWHCVDCPPNSSTDFCNDCVDCQHESGSHTASHFVEAKDQADTLQPFLDRDYIHFMGGDYNYLDSNYMPAT